MTFPTPVATTAYDNNSAAAQNWTPFTAQNFSGQFCVFVCRATNLTTVATASSGWVVLGSDGRCALLYKISGAASEELAITGTGTSIANWAGMLLRFTGADSINMTLSIQNSTSSPNPPQVGFGIGEGETADGTVIVAIGGVQAVTAVPTGFSAVTTSFDTTRMSTMVRDYTTRIANPDNATLAASDNVGVRTIVVLQAPAVPSVGRSFAATIG